MAPTRRETTTRSEKLDLRLTPEAKRALQSAAAASQRSVSEFVLESALQRAAETLPDRQRFGAFCHPGLDTPAPVWGWHHFPSPFSLLLPAPRRR